MATKEAKLIGYSLFALAIFFAMLIGVVLDTVNSYPPGAIITMFGITATRQEWFQNTFLVGIICIMLPTSLLIGYIGGHYNLDIKEALIVIITSLIVGSALWDLLFIRLYVIPNNIPLDYFLPWFDPFGLGLVYGLNLVNLATFKIEGGMILMDTEFLVFFSYLRLFIFVPALVYELWRFSQQ